MESAKEVQYPTLGQLGGRTAVDGMPKWPIGIIATKRLGENPLPMMPIRRGEAGHAKTREILEYTQTGRRIRILMMAYQEGHTHHGGKRRRNNRPNRRMTRRSCLQTILSPTSQW